MILDTEAQQRTMLRLSLEADRRTRRRFPFVRAGPSPGSPRPLDGLRGDLSDDQLHQLVLTIRATIGIEAIVWLVDVAGLSRDDAVTLTRWSAQALLRQGRRPTRRPRPDPPARSDVGRRSRPTHPADRGTRPPPGSLGRGP